MAAVNIIDTELLDAFEEYSGYGNTSVERVRFVLMKMNADRANKTNYFIHKFMDKIKLIFGGLPKPKEWRSLLENDLPLLPLMMTCKRFPFWRSGRADHQNHPWNPKNWRKPGARLPW